jgi:hypothetical protein
LRSCTRYLPPMNQCHCVVVVIGNFECQDVACIDKKLGHELV